MTNQLINGINYSLDDTNHVASVVALDNSALYTGVVTIPSSITYNSITYSVTSVGDDAFWNCVECTKVILPTTITSIDSFAFAGDDAGYSTVTVNIEVNLKNTNCINIGDSAFQNNLSPNIIIGDKVQNIGNSAFYNCTGLTSITIPNSVTSIGSSAFYGCTDLTSITIPNSVTSISDDAFFGCTGLTSITIPNSVTSIGDDSFSGCTGLTSVIIPNSVTTIGYETFYNCSSLISVTIPNSITSIGSSAFYGCTDLTSITIPNSVTSIGNWAFRSCSGLTSITIPNSVTTIDTYAFSNCTSLTSVTIKSVNLTNTTLNSTAFDNVNGTFYVPLDSYKSFNALSGKNVIVVPRTTYKSNTLLQWEGNSIDYEMNFDYYSKGLFTNTETGDIYLFGKKLIMINLK
jgi:hypothetical protein